MRTTIRLDDDLLAQAKAYAARSGKSLTAVISDALREALARYEALPEREHVCVVTAGGDGPLPGVDLDDSAALLDLMESSDDPA